jgi:hypothetical protein
MVATGEKSSVRNTLTSFSPPIVTYKVLHAAAKAIIGPGCGHVDLPGGILQQTVKVRALLSPLGTADAGSS